MNGITYSHEHMVIDLSGPKNDLDCYLNVYEEAKDELLILKELGVNRIVDCSNYGIGKNQDAINKLIDETGIEILSSTGFYKDPFLPDYIKNLSVDEIAEILDKDIKCGIKIIGEIGSSLNQITLDERKVFEASAKTAYKNDCVIITHTTLGTMAMEQIEIFKSYNVNLKKVIISHLALKNDLPYIIKVLDTGCNIAFDTIGKENYLSDDIRIEMILELCKLGYENQILMSMDLTRQSHLMKNKGKGYAYLLTDFVPKLQKAGLDINTLEAILTKNFTRILGE